ncbi:MAG TPA: hypothetical protein VMV72_01455 [Verrucomicrobiae bacterium]|nr:hypothetical protein [Verrucomicrobiae bacterium]
MKKSMMITALALSLSALGATAQDEGGPPPGDPGDFRGPPPVPLLVSAIDRNHDGLIDSNEIANASAALKTLDKNGDGKLTPDEYLGPRPSDLPADDAEGPHPPVPPIVSALDTNHDGIIDSNEIANASAALKTLDKNGDGKLRPDEYMGRPPHDPPDHQFGSSSSGAAGASGMSF